MVNATKEGEYIQKYKSITVTKQKIITRTFRRKRPSYKLGFRIFSFFSPHILPEIRVSSHGPQYE